MSDITASGYCITYGPCEYHATILPNALIDNDGREVPVRYYSTEINGVARLTHTDKGVIADVKLVPNEYSLAKMSSNSSGSWMVGDLLAIESGKSLKFGCMVIKLKKNKHNEVVHGTIAYVDISPFGLGDVVVFKEEE